MSVQRKSNSATVLSASLRSTVSLVLSLIVVICNAVSVDAQCLGTGSGATTPITVTDETVNLPGSRQLVNGSGSTIDTTVPGKISIDVSGGTGPIPLTIGNYSGGGAFSATANTYTNVTNATSISLPSSSTTAQGAVIGLTTSGSMGTININANGSDTIVFNGSTANSSVPISNADQFFLLNRGSGTWLVTSFLPQGGSSGGMWSVAQGGTGLATIPTNGVMLGNGTSSVSTASGTQAGQVLMWNASGAPSFNNGPIPLTIGSYSAGGNLQPPTLSPNTYTNVLSATGITLPASSGVQTGTVYGFTISGSQGATQVQIASGSGDHIIFNASASNTQVTINSGDQIFIANRGSNVWMVLQYLPNGSGNSTWQVPQGGTGNSSFPANNVIIGGTANALSSVAPTGTNTYLQWTGSGYTWGAGGGGGGAAGVATTSVSILPTPGVPAITTVGTAGSTIYDYAIVARDSNGNASPASFTAVLTTGNSVLSGSNYNSLTWTAVSGATSYDIYRTVCPYGANSVSVNSSPQAVAVNPSGSEAFVCNEGSGNVSVINTSNDTLNTTITVGTNPWAIAVAPNGYGYVCNSGSSSVTVLDTTANSVKSTVTVGTSPKAVAVMPDSSYAYVCNNGSGNITAIRASDFSTNNVNVGTSPIAIAVTPDKSKIYVANNGAGTVSVLSTAFPPALIATVNVGSQPNAIAVSPDSSKVYVCNGGSNSVSVISTTSNSVVATISTNIGSNPSAITISPDGKQAYVANQSGNSVSIINTITNSAPSSAVSVGTSPNAIAISPDGTRAFVTNSGSSSTSYFSVSTGTVIQTITLGSAPYAVAITPDGSKAYIPNQGSSTTSVLSVRGPFGKIGNSATASYSDKSLSTGDGTAPPSISTNTSTLSTSALGTQLLDCTNGNIVINLPDATTIAPSTSSQYTFKRIDSTNHVATIVGFNYVQIVSQGAPVYNLFNKGNPLSIQSDGTSKWRCLNEPSGASWSVGALPPKKGRMASDWGTHNMVVQGNDGQIYGWGLSTNGNLAGAITSGNEVVKPVIFDPNNPPATGTYIVDWAVTSENLFVALSDGTVYGAGLNYTGQLGINSLTSNTYLQRITFFNNMPVRKVWTFGTGSVGGGTLNTTFFLTSAGALYACGYNATGAIGIGSLTPVNVQVPTICKVITTSAPIYNPQQIRTTWTSSGNYTLLCDATGALYVVGFNNVGQLGIAGSTSTQSYFNPITISGAGSIVNVFPFGSNASGAANSAVIDSNGTLFMAGGNSNGQLAQGNTTANTSYGWFKVASTAAYNTGTASVSGGTAVTGSGTVWTSIPATATSLQIGFGSSPSTWYSIASINSATSITLTSNGPTSSGSYVIRATPIPNPIVDFAWCGQGANTACAALDSTNQIWFWGINAWNNLFYSNLTTPQSAPTANVQNAKILTSTNQMTVSSGGAVNMVYYDGSKLHISGTILASLIGVTDTSFTSGSIAVSLPDSILNGAEHITDIFANNNDGYARLFILTDLGSLYATGDNTSGVSNGGISNTPTSVGIYKIRM